MAEAVAVAVAVDVVPAADISAERKEEILEVPNELRGTDGVRSMLLSHPTSQLRGLNRFQFFPDSRCLSVITRQIPYHRNGTNKYLPAFLHFKHP